MAGSIAGARNVACWCHSPGDADLAAAPLDHSVERRATSSVSDSISPVVGLGITTLPELFEHQYT